MTSATDLIRQDHRKVKELYQRFEQTKNENERKSIVEAAIVELDIHARLEEEIFYPEVRRMNGQETEEMMNEAAEEHHVVETLMQELMNMKHTDPEYAAKFTVMMENVEHHVGEEESEMLPQAEELGPERLEELGQRMEQRRQELMTSGNGRQERSTSRGTARSRSGSSRSRSGGSSRSGSKSRSSSKSRGR